jgi:1,2-diacylglycerol 3-alpha-glucosyltransferase
MNIGIFTDTYSPQVNGVVSSILTLEKQLMSAGHNVFIFTISHPKADTTTPYVYRLPSMPFVFLKDHRVGLMYSPKIVRKIKRLKLDIILSQTEFSLGFFAKMVSKRLNIPMVHTYHTMYEEYVHYISKGVDISPEFARKYSKTFCNSVNGVVAPTEKTRNLLLSYGVKTPIRVIPTGIDFSPFKPSSYAQEEIIALKNEFSIPLDAPVALFIGRIAKEKSISTLLEAYKEVISLVPTSRLVIVGDGPEKQALMYLAEKLNITSHVIFTGMQPWKTIGKFYQLGDVFVSASVSETQGLTFAEAMAAHLPVVAKRDDSISGLVVSSHNGEIFDTTTELASILTKLLSDLSYCKVLGENASESVLPLSAELFGENALSYYQDILAAHHEKLLEPKTKRLSLLRKK